MTHLTKTRANVTLDGAPYVGQRVATFRYELVDTITGYRRVIHPIIESSSQLRHDTQATIKRSITGVHLDKTDTAVFNSISSRLQIFMIVRGEEFPLGTYVPADWAQVTSTAGNQSVASFYDETFIIDQQLPNAFGANSTVGETVSSALQRFLSRYPISYNIQEPTELSTLASWGAGTRGGQVLIQLALDGDYLSPWFDHDSVLQLRRTFDPAHEIPNFDFDHGGHVLRDGIVESDNLISAPNRFVVVGNGAGAFDAPVVGSADVPSSAPHSIENRGFVVSDVTARQVTSVEQATSIANSLAQSQTLFQQVELDTIPDPRHDSYDVILWRENKWVEIKWVLPLSANGRMSHTLRRVFS